jgi:hypothetical protein
LTTLFLEQFSNVPEGKNKKTPSKIFHCSTLKILVLVRKITQKKQQPRPSYKRGKKGTYHEKRKRKE